MKKFLVLLFLLIPFVFTACSQNINDETGLSGTINLAGSTSMEKLSNSLGELFMQMYPNVSVISQFTGSSAGISAVINKTADIGNSSRYLKDEEKEEGAVENIVAMDCIVIIANPNNSVDNLTKEQLVAIYDGSIRNWSEVGGEDTPIVVIGRESGSGTRSAFEEILDLEEKCKYAQEIDSTGAVVAKVSTIRGAIGYVSLDVIDDSVKTIAIDGVPPTTENVLSEEYILTRPFIMATNGEISEQSILIQEFFNLINSEDGKKLIEKVGLVSVS